MSLRGSTLMAPWCWAVASAVAVSGVELWAACADPGDAASATIARPGIAALRYLAAITTFLPFMAVLGAKRPQDRGWQFIVLSLWVILALPCIRSWLLSADSAMPPVHAAWGWFMVILLLLSCGNYLPSRWWPSCLLLVAGQTMLIWDWIAGSLLVGSTVRKTLPAGRASGHSRRSRS